jgi:hypothetical protein
MGHLVVMDDSEPQFALTAWSRRLWTELASELSPECEDDPCGTFWLAADEVELALVQRKAAFSRNRVVAVDVLSASELALAEPQLRPGLAGALYVPGDRVVYPPRRAGRWRAPPTERSCARAVRSAWFAPRSRPTPAGRDRLRRERRRAGQRPMPGLPTSAQGTGDHGPLSRLRRHELVELGYLKSAHTPNKDRSPLT